MTSPSGQIVASSVVDGIGVVRLGRIGTTARVVVSIAMDVPDQFGQRAARYENAAHRWQADRAVAHADLRPGHRVLDIATGTGLAARAAAEIVGPSGEVVGVDASARMLALAQAASGPFVRYVAGGGVNLPSELGEFDRVLCVAGLPYLGDPAIALSRWLAVCRPVAHLIITVPADRGILAFAILQDAAAKEGLELQTPNAGIGTPTALAALAALIGLDVVERVEESFDDGPLQGDADSVFDAYVDLGHARALAEAPSDRRTRVRAHFAAAYDRARGTPDVQRVVYARLAHRA